MGDQSSSSGAGTSCRAVGLLEDGPGSSDSGPVGGRGERSRIFRGQRVLLSRATTQRSDSDGRSRRGRLPRGPPPPPASTATPPSRGARPRHHRIRRRLLVLELRRSYQCGHDRVGWPGVEQRDELGRGHQLGVERRLRREHGILVGREVRFEQTSGSSSGAIERRSRRRGRRPGGGWHRGVRAPADGPLRHLRSGRNPLRRGLQHRAGHVRGIQRQPLPSPADGQQHDPRTSGRSPRGSVADAAAQDAFCSGDDLHDLRSSSISPAKGTTSRRRQAGALPTARIPIRKPSPTPCPS